MLSSLLALALNHAIQTKHNEPTPRPLLNRIEQVACSIGHTAYDSRVEEFEKANNVTLPDDIWEVTDNCE